MNDLKWTLFTLYNGACNGSCIAEESVTSMLKFFGVLKGNSLVHEACFWLQEALLSHKKFHFKGSFCTVCGKKFLQEFSVYKNWCWVNNDSVQLKQIMFKQNFHRNPYRFLRRKTMVFMELDFSAYPFLYFRMAN